MNVDQLIKRLKDGGWDGQKPVWLKSCGSAAALNGKDNIAKQLSDTCKVTVKGANTGHKYFVAKTPKGLKNPLNGKVHLYGDYTIGDSLVNVTTRRADPAGKWITYGKK